MYPICLLVLSWQADSDCFQQVMCLFLIHWMKKLNADITHDGCARVLPLHLMEMRGQKVVLKEEIFKVIPSSGARTENIKRMVTSRWYMFIPRSVQWNDIPTLICLSKCRLQQWSQSRPQTRTCVDPSQVQSKIIPRCNVDYRSSIAIVMLKNQNRRYNVFLVSDGVFSVQTVDK